MLREREKESGDGVKRSGGGGRGGRERRDDIHSVPNIFDLTKFKSDIKL